MKNWLFPVVQQRCLLHRNSSLKVFLSHMAMIYVQEATTYTPTSDPDNLNAVVWDFAGQVIFHNNHSIFISEYGVPVITFNASMKLTEQVVVCKEAVSPTECCTIIQSIHYWLQVMDCMCSVKGSNEDHSPLPPTALLAGTHIDKLHPNIKKTQKIAKTMILPILEKIEETICTSFGWNKKWYQGCTLHLNSIGNKVYDEEVDRLKDCTIAVVSSLRKEQPIFFLKIGQSLLFLEEQIISKPIMTNIIAKSSFSVSESSLEFKGVLSYFHIKRTILHFSQIESLKDLVILSPGWLVELFSDVLTDHSYITGNDLYNSWLQLTKYGILQENLFHMLKFCTDNPKAVHITKRQVIDILLCFIW